ncbi:MAG: hypothetical protein ACRDD2_04030 [Sarcina sp.]
MRKKIMLATVITSSIIFLIFGFLTVNIATTNSFNSLENERYAVNYEEIKNTVGIDLENFSNDNAIIKTYNNDKGFIIALGNYYFNLEENFITIFFVKGFDSITNSAQFIREKINDIFY